MKKKVILFMVASILIFPGCNSEKVTIETEALQNNAKRGILDISNGRTSHYPNVEDKDVSTDNNYQKNFEIENKRTEDRAEQIAQDIKNILGITKVSVVITGNTAIVGINVQDDLSDNKILDLKYEIENQVKSSDQRIEHVTVTATPELFERITNLSEDKQKNCYC